jgi:large subunit ribosomal protein L25
MSEIRLKAEKRTQFGKGAARRVRRDHKIPAVLYGHGTQPQHIALPGHETMLALKHANALFSLDIEGSEPTLAIAKDVQRDAVRRTIDHVDLVIVRRGEKVQVEIAVLVIGEAAAETLVTLDHSHLVVEAEATRLPESVQLSVEGLEAGTQILAGQVSLPDGVTLVTDPDALVVLVAAQVSAAAMEAELAEAEAEAGIEHEAPEPHAAEGQGAQGQGAQGRTAEGADAAQA